jgi:hypothetical protein
MGGVPRRFVLAQWPNPPLWIALAGVLVARLTGGWVHAYARGVTVAGLAAWAYLELTDGVNWFRRALGGAGLVYVVVQVAAAVHG